MRLPTGRWLGGVVAVVVALLLGTSIVGRGVGITRIESIEARGSVEWQDGMALLAVLARSSATMPSYTSRASPGSLIGREAGAPGGDDAAAVGGPHRDGVDRGRR